jgi:hypothetical protein
MFARQLIFSFFQVSLVLVITEMVGFLPFSSWKWTITFPARRWTLGRLVLGRGHFSEHVDGRFESKMSNKKKSRFEHLNTAGKIVAYDLKSKTLCFLHTLCTSRKTLARFETRKKKEKSGSANNFHTVHTMYVFNSILT